MCIRDRGKFGLDIKLSYPDVAATQVFPENLEFEAHQTFTSDEPGPEVKAIVPQPHEMCIRDSCITIRPSLESRTGTTVD